MEVGPLCAYLASWIANLAHVSALMNKIVIVKVWAAMTVIHINL